MFRTSRHITTGVACVLVAGAGLASSGTGTAATRPSPKPISVTSTAFDQGDTVPTRFTCDGADVSPPLRWRHIPKKAKSLALIVDDPDAPGGTWTHWVVLDIPTTTKGSHKAKVPKSGVQAKNSWGEAKYGGPCPPSGTHRYRFKLYALDKPTGLSEGAGMKKALAAVAKHTIKRGKLVALYSASGS